MVSRIWAWLQRPDPVLGVTPPLLRRLGVLWVCVSLPFVTAVSALAHTRDQYIFVWVFFGFGPYTLPSLLATWHAVRHVPPPDRPSYRMMQAGVRTAFVSGLVIFVALATQSPIAQAVAAAGVWVAGALIVTGVAMLIRRRSGHRALSVDLIEAAASVIALVAPVVVLWWPSIVDAPDRWWTLAASGMLMATLTGSYWVVLLWVRLGPGPRGLMEGGAILASGVGSVAAGLQIAQGVSGFTLWPPPLIAITGLAASGFLLIPLHAPLIVRDRYRQLPPQAQVRGAWVSTLVPLLGTIVLLAATASVADERSWAWPFTVAVLVVLAVLAALHHAASLLETKRLYREVEVTAVERRQLLAQLLDRSVADRERVAQELRKQALAAYTSFATLAATETSGAVLAEASRMLRDDMQRNAHTFHGLLASMRQRDEGAQPATRLVVPLQAYLATIYGERPVPRLTVGIAPELVLDWVVETVLMQVVQEALDNVCRHSEARAVQVGVEAVGSSVVVTVADDGVGFDVDPAAPGEGAGIASMRASAAAVGGELVVESRPGQGTTVRATLGSSPEPEPPPPPSVRTRLRLV